MAKFTWLVNRDRTVQDWREERLQCLGPKPVGVGEYKEGLRALQRPRGQRPAPDLARLEVARWGTCAQKLGINWLTNSARVGGTRELATGEIRDLRAPRSGYSEYYTPHLQAFWTNLPLPRLAKVSGIGRDARKFQGSSRRVIPPGWEIVVTI